MRALGLAPGVGYVLGEDPDEPIAYVASLPGGPIVVLSGTAASIWSAAVQGGARPREDITRAVAAAYELDPGDIRSDVEEFLDVLVADRLLLEK